MAVHKKDRVFLPNEAQAVTVRGVDDEDAVVIFYERQDGTHGQIQISPEAFERLQPLRATGRPKPNIPDFKCKVRKITSMVSHFLEIRIPSERAYFHKHLSVET